MSVSSVTSLLLLATLTLTPVAQAAIEALSASDRQFILYKHNEYRVNEPAVNMVNLVSQRSTD